MSYTYEESYAIKGTSFFGAAADRLRLNRLDIEISNGDRDRDCK